MKIRLAVNGVREGVDIRTGVWRASDSAPTAAEALEVTGLTGRVIFGLGFSGLV